MGRLVQKAHFLGVRIRKCPGSGLMQILEDQKQQANTDFGKFVEKEYKNWINNPEESPVLSHQIFRKWVAPELKSTDKVFFIVIDNLRYDQWKTFESTVNKYYKIEKDYYYYSILPTATQYARNAIFSGMTPLEMEKRHPEYWKNDTDEGGKNLFEEQFLEAQIKRLRLDIKSKYLKITNLRDGVKAAENFKLYKDNNLITLVYNFVDMISHAKTEMEVIKELASNDKAYRSLTLSWFKNSPLLTMIEEARKEGFKLIITTDHGTINCKNPDRKSTRLNSSHVRISYAVFCLKKKKHRERTRPLRGPDAAHSRRRAVEGEAPEPARGPAPHRRDGVGLGGVHALYQRSARDRHA